MLTCCMTPFVCVVLIADTLIIGNPGAHAPGLCIRSESSGGVECLWMDGCFEADGRALWLLGFGVAVPE